MKLADDVSATESASFDQTRQFNPSQQPIHSNDPDADVKKKIVLFNLPEPFGDDQMKEQADRNAFRQVLCAINAESLAGNIREIKREGRFEQNGRPRRVIVTFTDENVQRIVVECAPQLSKIRQLKHLALYAYKSPAQRFEPLPKQQTKRHNNKARPPRADGCHGDTSRKAPDQKFEQRGHKQHGKPSNVQSNDVNPKYPQRIFHNSFRFGPNGAMSDDANSQFPHTSPVPMETDDIELEAPTLPEQQANFKRLNFPEEMEEMDASNGVQRKNDCNQHFDTPLARKFDSDQRNAVDSLNGDQDTNLIREAQLNAHNINARLQDLSPEQQELYLKTLSKNLWREDKQDENTIEENTIAADIYEDNNSRKLFGTSQISRKTNIDRKFEDQDVVSAAKPKFSFSSSSASFHECQTNVQQLGRQFEKAVESEREKENEAVAKLEDPLITTIRLSLSAQRYSSRLLDHAARARPHNTSDTLSINETRTWIYQLIDPILKACTMIQRNLQQLDWQKKELMQAESNVEELRRLATIRVTSIEILQLSMPQTVCRSQKCARYERIDGKEALIYRVCHKDCKLSDIGKLDGCAVFHGCRFCTECSCHINDHERISYEQRMTTKSLENPQKLASEANAAEMKKISIRNMQRLIDGYQKESNYILFAMATFSAFLAENGITQKTNLFEQHLQKLIVAEEKKMKSVAGVDADEFNRLLELSVTYEDICKQFVHQRDTAKISLDELQEIRQKLFSMPLNGAMIAQIFDIHVKTDHQDYEATVARCEKSMFQ
ncbi:unnamed protein product, partial [Mesorhabditis belari]|uniref:DUF8206 domain-containing protein n=1 Tax=Mesorhabditis belari TaxID=2138241 RepID=A0AAF3FRX7_9BILA